MPAIHADGPQPFDVNVRLQIENSLTSKFMKGVLQDEAARIWRPYGVRLDWLEVEAAEIPDRFSMDAIVEPRIDGLKQPDHGVVLGLATVKLDAPSIRPIRLSLEATERVLTLRRNSGALAMKMMHDRVLARALGRVLAHEIGHVLLGAPYHDDAGLMRATYVPDELADPDRAPFRLTCTGVSRLRSRVRKLTELRFVGRQLWTGPEQVEGSFGIERDASDRVACIPGRMAR